MLLFFIIWCGTGLALNLFFFFIYFRSPKHFLECELYFEYKYKNQKQSYTKLVKDGLIPFQIWFVSFLMSIACPVIIFFNLTDAIKRFSFTDVFEKPKRNHDDE